MNEILDRIQEKLLKAYDKGYVIDFRHFGTPNLFISQGMLHPIFGTMRLTLTEALILDIPENAIQSVGASLAQMACGPSDWICGFFDGIGASRDTVAAALDVMPLKDVVGFAIARKILHWIEVEQPQIAYRL